jgi:putative DNA primase/helicase
MGDNVRSIDEARAQLDREAGAKPLQTFTDTDIANAKRLAEQHGADLHFTPERGWLVWDGRRWAADEKAVQVQARAKSTALAIFDEVKDSIDRDALFKHAKRSQQKGAIEAMIWLARSEPGIYMHIVGFDTDGYLFNVGNGTVDLRTGQLRPHRREDLISNIVDVPFDLDAGCELWDAFLWRVTDKSEELRGYLQRFVGYLLTGDTTEQALHFLYGLGANGKTVFCDVLMRILGDYAVAVSPDLIMVRRHSGIPNDVARLRGARAALMNETTQGARFDEAKLKDLTGGDVLTARFLHAEFFDFRPTHRIVIRGNHKPAINGTDEGIWRRLHLVPFTISIPKDEQDRQLLEKLAMELPGILQWAIQGCLAWQCHGLNPPSIITDAVRAYREESDTLGRFIEEHCEVRTLAQVKAGVFFQRYQAHAEQSGERWMPAKDLPHEMQRRGFHWKRTKVGCMYYGLELTVVSDPYWNDQ